MNIPYLPSASIIVGEYRPQVVIVQNERSEVRAADILQVPLVSVVDKRTITHDFMMEKELLRRSFGRCNIKKLLDGQ